MTTPVRTDLDAYRIAVAELPESAVASRDTRGAVAVVPGGDGWWVVASDAIAAGAAAVVVAQPAVAPLEALEALASLAGATPVVVERPLLRAGSRELLDRSAHSGDQVGAQQRALHDHGRRTGE